MDLNEFRTRIEKIDVLLREQGWDVEDRASVIQELDTLQSDFRSQNYKVVSETLRNDLDSHYADYLLLDSKGAPLAIIEAKRASKDPLVTAQRQAESYADDVKKQTGKEVFIFLSNGFKIWFLDRGMYPPRLVRGFFSRDSLERIRFQSEKRTSLAEQEINTEIVDRSKSIENVRRVLEHIEKRHRKGLIVMATGTGKTRVAMAIIDVLRNANWAQKILFLADRKALRNQAYNKGYKACFPEASRTKIISGKFDKNKELYVSTIQTFMECYNQKDSEGKYLISPAEFDLIISDEAHRSIYNKWREVFTYLDAIQIGLTATPAEFIERNTFRFFECTQGAPIALYDYEEAVKDKILCDFRKHVFGAKTHFQIKGVRKGDLSKDIRDELVEKGIDPDDIDFEGTDLEKKVALKGTSEAIVREFMENCIMDRTGTLPAKSIVFAISKKHARRLLEAFNKLYPEHQGNLARVIVSEDSRAGKLLEEFEEAEFPRVAISVDMLDTGVDIPEVCNLVFAKPVFSKIKFWQMIGRGTRSDEVCKHRNWMPDGKKDYFKIFDFWDNFEWHQMHAEGDESEATPAITSRLFLIRLEQMARAMESGLTADAETIKKNLIADVLALPKDSIMVREHLRHIERASNPKFWDSVGVEPLTFLKSHIAPLMRYRDGIEINSASFTLKSEQLGLATITNDHDQIERSKKAIGEMLECLPRTLDAVKEKEELLDRVLGKKFWEGVTYQDSQMLIAEFSELMKFKADEPRETLLLDMDDMIQQRKIIEFGPDNQEEYVERYRELVESYVKNLAKKHPSLIKLMHNDQLSEEDLVALEKTLSGPELFITEENLRRMYGKSGTLVLFVKNILGLYTFPEPSEKIREAFETYLVENGKTYTADQLNFIRTIQTVFVSKRHLVLADLYDAPFTNFGSNAPMPMFSEEELNEFIQLCESVEKEVFV